MSKIDARILLVEDDEDDYFIFQDLISEIKFLRIDLTWVDSYKAALEKAQDDLFDLYIIDYLLGDFTGIHLLTALKRNGLKKPTIILTGKGDHSIDVDAMEKGASDYLEKGNLTPQLLEKTIRYVIKQSESKEELRKSEEQLRLLSLKLIEAQEAERKRIAKELHDSICSNLAAVKFEIQKQIDVLKKKIPTASPDPFQHLIDMVQNSIEETRRIYTNLWPSILDDLGLLMAIQWACRNFQQTYSGIVVETDLKVEEGEIPSPLKIVIFRVIQEALNNVAKHSGADHVHMQFEQSEGKLILTIKDNGHGFDVGAKKTGLGAFLGGMGLASMKERVTHTSGSLYITSAADTGTRIQAIWAGSSMDE